jgi:hypothetical protein
MTRTILVAADWTEKPDTNGLEGKDEDSRI